MCGLSRPRNLAVCAVFRCRRPGLHRGANYLFPFLPTRAAGREHRHSVNDCGYKAGQCRWIAILTAPFEAVAPAGSAVLLIGVAVAATLLPAWKRRGWTRSRPLGRSSATMDHKRDDAESFVLFDSMESL